MLKVLHIGKFYPPATGGMERTVQSLCTSVRGRLDSRVIAYHSKRSTISETVDGVPVTRVGTWGLTGSVPVSPTLVSHLRRIEADLVVLHEPNPWALLSYALAAPRTPLAIWYHSEVVRPRLQYQLFYAPLASRVYRTARRFIVSSPALAEHAVPLRRYRDRTLVIPFGVDRDAATPDRAIVRRAEGIKTRLKGPIVLFAGRLVAYKGVDVLIDAIHDLPVTLVIAGDGPMRSTWSALAADGVRHGRVVFTGEIPDDELRAYFEASDMFVLPSVTPAEAFGFAQLEAMAHGKPVISTALKSGVPWVNRDQVTGIVVPPGDVGALRAAIRRLADDADLRLCMGAAGRQRACEDFSVRQMADKFVRICHDVVTDSSDSSVDA